MNILVTFIVNLLRVDLCLLILLYNMELENLGLSKDSLRVDEAFF